MSQGQDGVIPPPAGRGVGLEGQSKNSLFSRIGRRYGHIRSLPRIVVGSLDKIAAQLTRQMQEQQAGISALTAALSKVQADIVSLHGQTAAAAAAATRPIDALGRIVEGLSTKLNDIAGAASQADTQAALDRLHTTLALLAEASGTREAAAAERDAASARAVAALSDNARADVRSMVARLDAHSVRIDHLSTIMAEQARMLPSWMWDPESSTRVRSILALLEPVGVRDVGKIRVGRDLDGGYVMLDAFAGVRCALSLGIADDVSWDMAIAGRGIAVLQFDPSVQASPVAHDLFTFEALRIAPQDGPGEITLGTIMQTRLQPGDDEKLLLKMDVEGAEWAILGAVDETVLDRFEQIVCEFHDLDKLDDAVFGAAAHAVLAKLKRTHFVHHVHGNNCGSFVNVGNVVVPQTVEVSFARRGRFEIEACDALFPTDLDWPNQPGRADLYLGSFRF